MYKTRLNELCQKRRWATPEYERRDCVGPVHSPLFRASVAVNGQLFSGPEDSLFGTLKEAQNDAARVALDHFNNLNFVPCLPKAEAELSANVTKSKDVGPAAPSFSPVRDEKLEDSYKTLLKNYAEKNNLGIPVYDKESVNKGHTSRFNAWVTVGNQTFESPQLCDDADAAEEEVARAAFKSVASDGNLEGDSRSYKNLLNETAMALRLSEPKYDTNAEGPPHSRTFVSTVEIDNERFEGDVMKTKKQAENSAAKVAWTKFKERKPSKPSDSGKPSKPPGFGGSPPVKVNLPDFKGITTEHFSPNLKAEIKGEEKSTKGYSRIIVLPSKARSQLPEGATLLPFSDDVWIAASLPA